MIKSIVSLFALYQSALGNRLILQATQPAPPVQTFPWEVPQVQPVVPPPMPPVQPPPITFPGPPPGAVTPQPPPPGVVPPPPPQVGPVPPVAVPPAPTVAPPPQPGPVPPMPPPGTPITPPGGVPVFPGGPIRPPFTAPLQKTDCTVSPPAIGNCAMGIRNIVNPMENYELVCSVGYACYGSTMNIDFTPGGFPTETISLLSFVGEGAAMNANINVNNFNGRNTVRVEQIKCDKPGACQNTRFVFGPDVEFNQGDFYCTPGACDGATINGEPATLYMEQI